MWLILSSYHQCKLIDPIFTSSRGSLEGKREQKSYKALLEDPMLRFSGLYQENCSDLYVTCQVFAEGKPLALPVRTSYKAFSTRWKWALSCLFVLGFDRFWKPYFSSQLERVVAAAGEVPGPSSKRPGCSHGVGHLWTGQGRPSRGDNRHAVWQIRVSRISDTANAGRLSIQTSPRQACFFLACSGKGCMTWKCGREWRETVATPPPHRDGQAAAWQKTRWADSPR